MSDATRPHRHSLGERNWQKRDAGCLALAVVIVATASAINTLRRWWTHE